MSFLGLRSGQGWSWSPGQDCCAVVTVGRTDHSRLGAEQGVALHNADCVHGRDTGLAILLLHEHAKGNESRCG